MCSWKNFQLRVSHVHKYQMLCCVQSCLIKFNNIHRTESIKWTALNNRIERNRSDTSRNERVLLSGNPWDKAFPPTVRWRIPVAFFCLCWFYSKHSLIKSRASPFAVRVRGVSHCHGNFLCNKVYFLSQCAVKYHCMNVYMSTTVYISHNNMSDSARNTIQHLLQKREREWALKQCMYTRMAFGREKYQVWYADFREEDNIS